MGQAMVDGVMTGVLFAAFGIGLSLIYGVTKIISAVHGAFMVLGAYLAFELWAAWGLDPFLAIPLLAIAGFVVGYTVQRWILNSIVKENVVMTITATFGLDLIAITLFLLLFGPQLQSLMLDYASSGVTLLGVRIVYVRLGIVFAAVLLAVGLNLMLTKTEQGRRIRAVSQDPVAAEMLGLDPGHYFALAHGYAAAVAVATGAFVAMTQPLHPFMGLSLLLIAFAVVVLAGFGSIVPVLMAGLLLGIVSSVAGYLAGPQYQVLAVFVVYLAVAMVRPQGLFGKKFYAH